MIEAKNESKIDFSRIRLEDRAVYEEHLADEVERGCEFSFANLYLWGRQSIAFVDGHIALFSQFDRRSVYPYPLGKGDKRGVLDSIIDDAASRGIPCRITGLGEHAKETLDNLYPGKFRFHTDEGSYDYVYDIDSLADLPGRKYHGKRNHMARFVEANPDYTAEPIDESNIEDARAFADLWYERRLAENPDADFHMERAALERAFRDFKALALEGLMLRTAEGVVAITMASRMSHDTFDVNFEKARADVQGAYVAINCSFARYIREKFPDVRYLDREEDMGLEGLRRAKQSYHPHHRVKKYWACLLEDGYDY